MLLSLFRRRCLRARPREGKMYDNKLLKGFNQMLFPCTLDLSHLCSRSPEVIILGCPVSSMNLPNAQIGRAHV